MFLGDPPASDPAEALYDEDREICAAVSYGRPPAGIPSV
jgi:hypothetical protein